ncbi:hypothetical protein HMPREF9554_01981 [Treponema phagedenis F0421]|nr:hypothetical protein HMPREF9554_01981 [Treponema phagedenis F0421]
MVRQRVLKLQFYKTVLNAFKHRLNLSKGEQFTIGMFKSAVPYC